MTAQGRTLGLRGEARVRRLPRSRRCGSGAGELASGKDDSCTEASVTPLGLLMGLEAARTRCQARQLVRAASVTPFDLQNLLGLLLLEETC